MISEELVSAIVGSGGVIVPVGVGIGWIWRKVERRFKLLEGKMRICEAREAVSNERRQVHVTVIELLWQELARFTGEKPNRTMTRAKKLLDDLKTLPPAATNPELERLVAELGDMEK
ncbi:hypothetical protein [Novosphingobium sp.]|uniref:hypothetical protein n=1 Tax=Novosphingobium sp. TaxID=1874826 RepID=UPI00286E8514|nr:hypothetical protein [Novosphingobium sp.]